MGKNLLLCSWQWGTSIHWALRWSERFSGTSVANQLNVYQLVVQVVLGLLSTQRECKHLNSHHSSHSKDNLLLTVTNGILDHRIIFPMSLSCLSQPWPCWVLRPSSAILIPIGKCLHGCLGWFLPPTSHTRSRRDQRELYNSFPPGYVGTACAGWISAIRQALFVYVSVYPGKAFQLSILEFEQYFPEHRPGKFCRFGSSTVGSLVQDQPWVLEQRLYIKRENPNTFLCFSLQTNTNGALRLRSGPIV